MQNELKPKTSRLQKLFYFCFALIVLEICLQITDISWRQWTLAQRRKELATNEKVILCVGDSTTAVGLDSAYPYLLQKKLDQIFGKGKYKVVNAGVPGLTTKGTLAGLSEDISMYRPSYIITLLGVNDVLLYDGKKPLIEGVKIFSYLKSLKKSLAEETTSFDFDPYPDFYSNNLIKDLKTSEAESAAESAYRRQDFELAESLYLALPESHVPSESMLWNMAIIHFVTGRKEEALRFFMKLKDVRDDIKVNYSIAWYYINHHPSPAETQLAISLAKKALDLEPANIRALHFMGQIYKNELKLLDEAEIFYKKANSLARCNLGVTVGLSDLLQKQEKYSQAIEVLESCADSDEVGAYDLWRRLINLYIIENQPEKAKQSVLEAKSRFPDYVMLSILEKKVFGSSPIKASWNFLENEFTIKNYQKIARLINENRIKHIAMHYPLQDIRPLKAALAPFENITFVSQEDNYRQSIAKYGYNKIFLDKVTDDFGHSTKLGNEILVDRLVETLQGEGVL